MLLSFYYKISHQFTRHFLSSCENSFSLSLYISSYSILLTSKVQMNGVRGHWGSFYHVGLLLQESWTHWRTFTFWCWEKINWTLETPHEFTLWIPTWKHKVHICPFPFIFNPLLLPPLWQVECAVHNPEPHINIESTADTPVVGHGCVWVRHFSLIVQKRSSVFFYI